MPRPITSDIRKRVNDIIRDEWAGPIVVSKGRAIDTSTLPGFVFEEGNEIVGLATYEIIGSSCELVTLVSFTEGKGIGSALIDAVAEKARELACKKLYLITTNDNIHAIRFYQRRGFSLVNVDIGGIAAARRIKPGIPLVGMDNIPILHEFEFEMEL